MAHALTFDLLELSDDGWHAAENLAAQLETTRADLETTRQTASNLWGLARSMAITIEAMPGHTGWPITSALQHLRGLAGNVPRDLPPECQPRQDTRVACATADPALAVLKAQLSIVQARHARLELAARQIEYQAGEAEARLVELEQQLAAVEQGLAAEVDAARGRIAELEAELERVGPDHR